MQAGKRNGKTMNSSVIDHQQALEKMMAERYLLGELSSVERDAFEAHLFECAECFEQVRAGTEFVRYVKRLGAEEAAAETTKPQKRPFWRGLLGPALRPAPAFALLFVCFAGLSLYQATLIHRFKESRAMAAPMLKAARRGGDGNLVTAPRNGLFPLHLLFAARAEYVSYEGQIFRDRLEAGAPPPNPGASEGSSALKSFSISRADAQDAIAVNLYSGDLQEGNYRLEVFGVRSDGSKTNVATYFFRLEFQK